MIVSCITGDFTTIFIMKQINLTRFVSFSRINICHNTMWSELHTFNGIRHKIFSDRVKVLDRSIITDQDLFQSIRNLSSIYNLIFYAFSIGRCV